MFKVLMLDMGFISLLRQDFFLFSRVVLLSLYLKSSVTCSYAATTNSALEVRLSECAVYNSRKIPFPTPNSRIYYIFVGFQSVLLPFLFFVSTLFKKELRWRDFVCLLLVVNISTREVFSYMEMSSERQQILTYAWHSRLLSIEDSLACHTTCVMVISQDP